MIITFYGDQVWDEYTQWSQILTGFIPTGLYAYDEFNQKWYQYRFKWEIISVDEVPPMCKAWVLIL